MNAPKLKAVETLRPDEIDHGALRRESRPAMFSPPELPGPLATKVRSALNSPSIWLEDISDAEAALVSSALQKYDDEGLLWPSDADIISMIGQLALLYPGPKLSVEEATVRLELYVDLLGDIPLDILRHAFREVAKASKFFPTVAEIRAEAEHLLTRRQAERSALYRLLRKHEGW